MQLITPTILRYDKYPSPSPPYLTRKGKSVVKTLNRGRYKKFNEFVHGADRSFPPAFLLLILAVLGPTGRSGRWVSKMLEESIIVFPSK